MSWICHDPKFVFLHNPRCAGTSIIEALSRHCELTAHAGPDDPEAPNFSAHVLDHSWVAIPPCCKDYPIIATIRNPHMRELSYYLWSGRHPCSKHPVQVAARCLNFTEYLKFRVEYNHYTPFYQRIFGNQSTYLGDIQVDRLLRVETLHVEWPVLTAELFGRAISLPVADATVSPPYDPADYYTPTALRLVRQWAADDFQRFNYDPEKLPC